ncbi:unnamed protein product [Strongylus vulgaris]|uniref:Uncharacterized protein n=1 Tax=Strongylus vulgaris TaxID=40348 RepID=A0A3P7IY65_STRVU|nr:unnamed protein product [Strongylus vulgaris]
MADPELASKLARRLENINSFDEEDAQPHKEPPPAPVLPEKVVANPYVASDDSVSIDDLIAKTLERNEHESHSEENNNNGAHRGRSGVRMFAFARARATDVFVAVLRTCFCKHYLRTVLSREESRVVVFIRE